MNNKRRTTFAFILAFAIAMDMISTHLMVASGYRELTGLIVLMLSVSKWLLYLWVIFWWCMAYILYPLMERMKITIHFEAICLWYAFMSLTSSIGNFYLYLKFGT